MQDLKTKLETALDILNSGDTEFIVSTDDMEDQVALIKTLRYYICKDTTFIHRKPQWQLTNHLPGFRALEDGEEWHTTEGWVEADLPAGYRPLLKGEPRSPKDTEMCNVDESTWRKSTATTPLLGTSLKARTTRPLPLGIEELANAIRTAKFKAENTKAQQWAATSTLTKDAWIAAAKKAKELLTTQP